MKLKTSFTPAALLLLCFLVVPPPASAQRGIEPARLGIDALNSQPRARLMLHVTPGEYDPDGDATCRPLPSVNCKAGAKTFTTEAPLSTPETPYDFVYVIATGYEHAPGFAGAQFGIDYDGVPGRGADVLQWTGCSVLEFPAAAWPAPASGNLTTWFPDHPDAPVPCERGGFTVVGYFTVAAYSPDVMRLTPRPVDGALKVADCSRSETILDPSAAGAVGFGGLPGADPCEAGTTTDVRPSDPRLFFYGIPAENAHGSCTPDLPSCIADQANLSAHLPLAPGGSRYLIYVLMNADRSAGLDHLNFGINYAPAGPRGIVIDDFQTCSSDVLPTRGWPASGSTVTVGGIAEGQGVGGCTIRTPTVVGWFFVTVKQKGVLTIRPEFTARWCGGSGTTAGVRYADPADVGSIDFGEVNEAAGCLESASRPASETVLPVELKSWSAVKSMYRD